MSACAVCNLAQIRAWQPSTDRDRRAKQTNITQAEHWITERGAVCTCETASNAT